MRQKGYSINEAQKAIDKAYLKQNNRIIKKNEIICGKVELDEFQAHDIGIKPLFYNEDFCVYDKPHNLLSHPKGRFHHYSLNDAIKSHFGNQAKLLHRLDRQTSGLLLCAINPNSEKELKILMQQRKILKSYHAIVEGKITDEMLIDKPISTQKHKGDLHIKSIVCQDGKPSRTIIRPLVYYPDTNSTLIVAIALTGRTHQIRLHCAFIGHRILGDPLYGTQNAHSRYYLENPNLPECEYAKYFGAPYLCLNANGLDFSFRGRDYSFRSALNFNINPSKKKYN